MTKSQLKMLIKECLKEIRLSEDSEKLDTLNQLYTTDLVSKMSSLFQLIKRDPILRKNNIKVSYSDRTVTLYSDVYEDFFVEIEPAAGGKYVITLPSYTNSYSSAPDGSSQKEIIVDLKGVLPVIYKQIKAEIG